MEEPSGMSESGDPIFRHEARERSFAPAAGDQNAIAATVEHIERHLGPVASVFHEVVSDLVHIDLHHVRPSAERPFHTLITSGMSDRPMAAPAHAAELRYAELMLALPPDWPMDEESWADERHYWPLRWLKVLARLPHEYETWLGYGHTVPNGDPPAPFAEDTGLSGFIVLSPQSSPESFHRLQAGEEKVVHFYSIVPLHADEMDMKLKRGTEALLTALDREGVDEVVRPDRPSALKKKRSWWRS